MRVDRKVTIGIINTKRMRVVTAYHLKYWTYFVNIKAMILKKIFVSKV